MYKCVSMLKSNVIVFQCMFSYANLLRSYAKFHVVCFLDIVFVTMPWLIAPNKLFRETELIV